MYLFKSKTIVVFRMYHNKDGGKNNKSRSYLYITSIVLKIGH